jgi:hypothetical protein
LLQSTTPSFHQAYKLPPSFPRRSAATTSSLWSFPTNRDDAKASTKLSLLCDLTLLRKHRYFKWKRVGFGHFKPKFQFKLESSFDTPRPWILLPLLLLPLQLLLLHLTWSGSGWFWFGQICRRADQNCWRAVDSTCHRKTTTMYTDSKIPRTFEITDTTTAKMSLQLTSAINIRLHRGLHTQKYSY